MHKHTTKQHTNTQKQPDKHTNGQTKKHTDTQAYEQTSKQT